jgi:hypothetical protein
VPNPGAPRYDGGEGVNVTRKVGVQLLRAVLPVRSENGRGSEKKHALLDVRRQKKRSILERLWSPTFSCGPEN